MEKFDISDIELGDILEAPRLGFGPVVECTEKPSVRVKFDIAGLRWITQHSAERLGVKKL